MWFCVVLFFRDICDLAEKYNALTFIDECHATGFFGDTGRQVLPHFLSFQVPHMATHFAKAQNAGEMTWKREIRHVGTSKRGPSCCDVKERGPSFCDVKWERSAMLWRQRERAAMLWRQKERSVMLWRQALLVYFNLDLRSSSAKTEAFFKTRSAPLLYCNDVIWSLSVDVNLFFCFSN